MLMTLMLLAYNDEYNGIDDNDNVDYIINIAMIMTLVINISLPVHLTIDYFSEAREKWGWIFP